MPSSIEPVQQQFTRKSYRWNSPQMRREVPIEQLRMHLNYDDDNIDVKKTIKLSKNYVKDLCLKNQE
jgi:hypothetical protein